MTGPATTVAAPLPLTEGRETSFPFDLFRLTEFSGSTGTLMAGVRDLSMFPPYPWGHWAYSRLFRGRCASLEGDVIEAGAGLGGMSLFFGSLIQSLGLAKKVLAVDSFQGLPPPGVKDNSYFSSGQYGPTDGDGAELLKAFWAHAAVRGLDRTVKPIKGFFADVLPEIPAEPLCFVHIDADLFESVYCALENLYDNVVDGGIIAIDDFFHPAQGPLRAASEFFNSRAVSPLFHVVFPYSVFVIKGEQEPRRSRAVDGNTYSLAWLRGDDFFVREVAKSLERSRPLRRAYDNCALLLNLLRSSEDGYSDIYDYWRALEEFWEWADTSHARALRSGGSSAPAARPQVR